MVMMMRGRNGMGGKRELFPFFAAMVMKENLFFGNA